MIKPLENLVGKAKQGIKRAICCTAMLGAIYGTALLTALYTGVRESKADTIYLSQTGQSLQYVIDNVAQDGDTIKVDQPGNYGGIGFRQNNKNLKLEGLGRDKTFLGGVAIQEWTGNLDISRFTIETRDFGVFGYGFSGDLKLAHNTIEGGYASIFLFHEGNAILHNNLFLESSDGITIAGNESKYATIVNNTFDKVILGVGYGSNLIKNNLFTNHYDPLGFEFGIIIGEIGYNNFLNGDNNYPYGFDEHFVNSLNSTNLFVDPLFADNFHLSANSPLIDAGVDVGLPFIGNAPDIGAFEFPEPSTLSLVSLAGLGYLSRRRN